MLNFLNLKPEFFGLDISDKAVKIIKLAKKHGGFKLVSFNEEKIKPGILEKGIIKDEEALVKIIKKACETVKGEKLKTKYVAVSLPEEKSFVEVITMPSMKESELKLAVPFEAENYVPLPIDQVYLDFQPIVPIEKGSNRIEILIVAMPKATVDSYVSCVKKADLIPSVLQVESQAITNALTNNSMNDLHLVLIDVGESRTNLVVLCNRSIRFTCSFDVSFQKKNLKFSESELSDLVGKIRKYLFFYQDHASCDHVKETQKAKIILSGSMAGVKDFSQALSKELNLEVQLGNPWINVFSSFPKGNKFNFNKDSLSFTTAIGLSLCETENKNIVLKKSVKK
jgi:type IV pilus assembly protein PilM